MNNFIKLFIKFNFFQNKFNFIKNRSFSLNYKNISDKLRLRLDLFCASKLKEYNEIMKLIDFNNPNKVLIERYKSLQPIIDVLDDLEQLRRDTEELNNLVKDSHDNDLLDVMEMEKKERIMMQQHLFNKLIEMITSSNDIDKVNEVSFEILCGAGGQESMIFAEELLVSYKKYIAKQNWIMDKRYCNTNDTGGLRSCKYIVSGQDVYCHLKYESGIHRVQRVPSTSSLGKIHTSTVAVVVLPHIEDTAINIPEGDLKWDYFKSSGPGGQHVNKTDSAVRVTHIPTGVSVCCQTTKLQQSNKKEALFHLTEMLNEKEIERKLDKINSNRRIVIGSRARSDKIRTYNYQQDRLTDHRIHRSWSNLLKMMNEGDFGEVTSSLVEVDSLDQLENVLNEVEDVNLTNK